MPAVASQKREHDSRQPQPKSKQSGRYRGREEEVAARIVNKQRSAYGETRAEKQKDKTGKSPDRDLPISDYQTMSIAQIKSKLDSLAVRDLKKLRGYEVKHKNRKGMLAELDRRIAHA